MAADGSAAAGGRGCLYLVVGPSGAGKDSLIDAARERLAGAHGVVFPRRVITRPAAAGGEAHEAVSADEFAARARRGEFVLHWSSHGLCYGIPAAIDLHLRGGCAVVVNVSRTVIDTARAHLAPVRVLSISASRATLRRRLLARGREDAGSVDRRLERAGAFAVSGGDVVEISNDGDLQTALDRFVVLLARER